MFFLEKVVWCEREYMDQGKSYCLVNMREVSISLRIQRKFFDGSVLI